MSQLHQPRIEAIFISPGHDFKGRFGKGRRHHGAQPVEAVACHAGRGLVGDRYYDHKPDYKGQVTFFEAAVADAWAGSRGGPVEFSAFRRNVVTRGVDLNALIGRRFRLGEVLLEGVEECAPCFWMEQAIGPGAEVFLKGRGGLRCRIRESGWLRLGPVELEVE